MLQQGDFAVHGSPADGLFASGRESLGCCLILFEGVSYLLSIPIFIINVPDFFFDPIFSRLFEKGYYRKVPKRSLQGKFFFPPGGTLLALGKISENMHSGK